MPLHSLCINPENNKFFVGTKSVFNRTLKINYTVSDINRNIVNPVASKLQVCLRELKKLGIRGILPSDLLFTSDDKKVVSIDGQSMISFTLTQLHMLYQLIVAW